MSQIAFMKDMDAAIIGAFLDAGMADTATYTPPGGGAGVACNVLVDRNLVQYGADGAPVATRRTAVTFQLAEVASPERLGKVVVDGSEYELDFEDANDGSLSRWLVA